MNSGRLLNSSDVTTGSGLVLVDGGLYEQLDGDLDDVWVSGLGVVKHKAPGGGAPDVLNVVCRRGGLFDGGHHHGVQLCRRTASLRWEALHARCQRGGSSRRVAE